MLSNIGGKDTYTNPSIRTTVAMAPSNKSNRNEDKTISLVSSGRRNQDNDNATTAAPTSSCSVKIILTGFGNFRGVAINPTEILVSQLQDYIEKKLMDDELSCRIQQCLVMETSVQGVQQSLNELYDEISRHKDDTNITKIIILHLGVKASSQRRRFEFEQYAYNEMTFRCPDQQGYQPQREPIVISSSNNTESMSSNQVVGSSCPTSWDWNTIGPKLNNTLSINEATSTNNNDDKEETSSIPIPTKRNASSTNYPTIPSTNPGRFVCNYAYYYSLQKSLMTSNSKNLFVKPLFLHVPPTDQISIQDQLQCIYRLLQVLVSECALE